MLICQKIWLFTKRFSLKAQISDESFVSLWSPQMELARLLRLAVKKRRDFLSSVGLLSQWHNGIIRCDVGTESGVIYLYPHVPGWMLLLLRPVNIFTWQRQRTVLLCPSAIKPHFQNTCKHVWTESEFSDNGPSSQNLNYINAQQKKNAAVARPTHILTNEGSQLEYATSLPLANLFVDCLVCNIIGQPEKGPIVRRRKVACRHLV